MGGAGWEDLLVQAETLFICLCPKGHICCWQTGGDFSWRVGSCHLGHIAAWSNTAPETGSVKSVVTVPKSTHADSGLRVMCL